MKPPEPPGRRTTPKGAVARTARRNAPATKRQPLLGHFERELRTASLNYVTEESMSRMVAGDILLLEGTTSLRACVAPAFYAILACPLCGKLDLITQKQFFGTDAVVCAHKDCSCHFRIDLRHRVTYLPVN